MAVVSVSAGDRARAGWVFFCGGGDHVDPGGVRVSGGAGVSGAGDRGIGGEGLTEAKRNVVC